MKILFVCFGNISRSFLAEALLKYEAASMGANHIVVSSAGLSAHRGNPPDPEMVVYLNKMGVPFQDHRARQLTEFYVDWADMIMVMEKGHGSAIRKAWPQSSEKIEHLGKFIAENSHLDDIVDPYGKSPYHYRLAQAQITVAVRSLLHKLTLGS